MSAPGRADERSAHAIDGADEPPPDATDWRVRTRQYWPIAALVLLAVVIAIVVHHFVYPAYSWNRDEPVYLWTVEALRSGQIFTSGGGAPRFFQPWLTGVHDGMFFSQYTPGWPLVLAAGEILFGTPTFAIALGAGLAVLGTYLLARELTGNHTLATVSAAIMVASPILIVQSGIYISYLFSLGLGLIFGATFLGGLRRAQRWPVIVGGLCLGYLFMTRPFDAVLWAAPFVVYALYRQWGRWRSLVRTVLWSAVGFLPFAIATLLYNRHVTGSFTEFPITFADPLDTFGFGTKSIATRWPKTPYGLRDAVRGVGRNLLNLPLFLFGTFVGLVVAAVGLWIRRRDRSTIALLLLGAAFPVGYFFFWGISLSASFSSVSGPIYLLPMYAPLCILIATVLVTTWQPRRTVAIVLVAVLVVATIPLLVLKLDQNHSISVAQEPWREAGNSIRGRALVFVGYSGPYLLHLNPFSENPPDLDGRILYAADRGPENLDLIAERPGRIPYFEVSSLSRDETLTDHNPPVPTITVTRATIDRGTTVTVRATVTNPGDDPTVVAYLQIGNDIEARTLSTTAQRGDVFDTEWTVAPSAAAVPGATPLPERLGEVVVGFAAGATADAALAAPHHEDHYAYRVDGTTAEVLTPGRPMLKRFNKKGKPRLQRAEPSPSLDVDISAES